MDATERLTIGDGEGGGPVTVAGELDAYTAPALEDFLQERIGEGGAVHLDLAGVTFMDSSGVRVIVNADNELRTSGSELVIHDPSPVVARLLQLTSLDDRLTIETT